MRRAGPNIIHHRSAGLKSFQIVVCADDIYVLDGSNGDAKEALVPLGESAKEISLNIN